MHFLKTCIILCLLVTARTQQCNLFYANNLSDECFQKIASGLWNPMQRNASFNLTAFTVNQLMDAPVNVMRRSQFSSGSTDEVLRQFDASLLNQVKQTKRLVLEQKNLVVTIFDVVKTPVAGVAVYKDGPNGALRSVEVFRNSTLRDVVAGGDLLVSAYLPPALLTQIGESGEATVTITIFFKDTLFVQERFLYPTSGIVIGVLIPGFREDFNAPIKLAYKHAQDDRSKGCAHWDFASASKGSWKQEDRSSTCGEMEICEYYHVTHFGMLVLNSTDSIKQHEHALDVITIIGCSLSLVGIFGIFLTGVLFAKWRENKGNVILMNQALATLLEIICLYISDYVKENTVCDETWCFWSGILLHYTVLAQFFWVLVISFLQYKRYVQIIGPPTNHLLLKSCLIGWGGPLPIILTLGIFFSSTYKKNSAGLCYPSGTVLFVGVLLPILLIVLINTAIFILIMTSVFWKKIEVPRLADNVNILRVRLVVLLFFQLGLSWMFGFMSNLGIGFVYLFCITATSQGFIIFLLFIVFNTAANKHYKKLLGIGLEKSKKTTTTTDSSTSTRLTH